jgi:hypothetical protein
MNFRNHILSYVLVPLVIIVGIFSYFRFIVNNDYVVGYQGACDPATGKCFVSCEDDACTKQSYYAEIQKYAPDLYRECGKDITDCEAASKCLPEDRKCSVTYCNKDIKGDVCQTGMVSVPENPLQDNNTNNTNL